MIAAWNLLTFDKGPVGGESDCYIHFHDKGLGTGLTTFTIMIPNR